MSSNKSSDELNLDEIIDLIIDGYIDDTRELADRVLQAGVNAHDLITTYLVPAMEEVGDLFEILNRQALRLAQALRMSNLCCKPLPK